MDKEARKIARHHLGDTLTTLMRGGPHAADWIVFARHGKTEVSARAPTVDAAAADCASQLRAAGWSPSHARLEWADNRLYLCMDNTRFVVATYLLPACDVLIHPDFSKWRRYYSQAAMVAAVAEWCATNLPSLHLPPFPETPMPLDPHEVQAETVRYLVAKNQELAAEVARLTAALAAAQSERDRLRATLDSALCMVVEGPDAVGSREACRSAAKILSDGLSAQTGRAPIAPHLVRLHQAYEGTTVCLHCGEPMPWSEMEVCPRAPKDLRA